VIKSILIPATGNDADTATFAAALGVARMFAAHIGALHVRLDPVEIAVATTTDGGGGGMLLQGLIDDLEREADAREARTKRFFTEFCAREGLPLLETPMEATGKPSAQWHVEIGQEPRWMSVYGTTADLIVSSRGIPGDDAVTRSTLEALLLETGRPLLIPSAAAPSVAMADRVAIAWKPTPQAARAVAAAMPFLACAKEIVVMTVEEEEGRRDEIERLLHNLAWHGLKVVAQRVKPGTRDAAEALLAAVVDQAGLLVMGGYGHSRLREWVFGGFTQQVLVDAPVPVLMAH
jgi:nucleotide-binding universal stress UspA family protein